MKFHKKLELKPAIKFWYGIIAFFIISWDITHVYSDGHEVKHVSDDKLVIVLPLIILYIIGIYMIFFR